MRETTSNELKKTKNKKKYGKQKRSKSKLSVHQKTSKAPPPQSILPRNLKIVRGRRKAHIGGEIIQVKVGLQPLSKPSGCVAAEELVIQ